MKYVSLLLHMYQPPTQARGMVERIDAECYTPLSRLLADTGASVAVNMNYSLTRQLAHMGSEALSHLASAEGVEFTDSGAYHPIFPLISREDVQRQLNLNRDGNRRLLGDNYDPKGVFPPEMAYSSELPGIFPPFRIPMDRHRRYPLVLVGKGCALRQDTDGWGYAGISQKQFLEQPHFIPWRRRGRNSLRTGRRSQ